ncbi:peptidase U32 family protein, partial [Ruminobacter sp.]|uniref:peptidase U32 family protein n=1 Tax=Ruminobacter sp. TaxID=2774296 RepID=UPI00386E69EC
MRSIELLAPAKDLKCGMTAILSGADAVYIGGPSYGARVNAPNSVEDIRELCDFAHQYGARVHVALNTILNDEELREARDLAFRLYDAGADALIIQDLGLLNGELPPIELHASTQQDNSSPDKIRFLEQAGFSQAVLARELSLNDIRKIREAAHDIKLEAFVHGALCVGMSGRCYLSAAVTGRSANRGE